MTKSASTRRATLADVAELAGTSKAAVSYVVNDSPRPVSEKLRRRIEAALEELDYRPNHTARALRTRATTPIVGLLVPNVTMPFFSQVTDAVQRQAERNGHLVLFANTDFDSRREAEATTRLIASGVDGLIVLGEGDGSATARVCSSSRIPVVWVHNDRGDDPRMHVTADHEAAGILATQHVLPHSPSPIFIGGFTAEETHATRRETVVRRYEGYLSALWQAGRDGQRIATDLTPAGAYQAVSDFLSAGFTGHQSFVVGTHGQANAVVAAVRDAGLIVPDDISVVTFDGGQDPYHPFPVTTVRQDLDTVAANALALITEGPDAPQQRVDFVLDPGITTKGSAR